MKHNLSVAELYEESIKKNLAILSNDGTLVVDTRPYTGRSPKDKFIVYEEETKDDVWWGEVNQPFDEEHFNKLLEEVKNYLNTKDIYIEDLFVFSVFSSLSKLTLLSSFNITFSRIVPNLVEALYIPGSFSFDIFITFA